LIGAGVRDSGGKASPGGNGQIFKNLKKLQTNPMIIEFAYSLRRALLLSFYIIQLLLDPN